MKVKGDPVKGEVWKTITIKSLKWSVAIVTSNNEEEWDAKALFAIKEENLTLIATHLVK